MLSKRLPGTPHNLTLILSYSQMKMRLGVGVTDSGLVIAQALQPHYETLDYLCLE